MIYRRFVLFGFDVGRESYTWQWLAANEAHIETTEVSRSKDTHFSVTLLRQHGQWTYDESGMAEYWADLGHDIGAILNHANATGGPPFEL